MSKQRFNIVLSAEARSILEEQSTKQGLTMSAYLEVLLRVQRDGLASWVSLSAPVVPAPAPKDVPAAGPQGKPDPMRDRYELTRRSTKG